MASQIRFEPSGANGLVASGTTIAAAAERLGVAIEMRCGGKGECTTCAVRAVDEPFSLSPMTDAERGMLSEADILGGIRLGCQARTGHTDCTIHVLDAAERPAMPEGANEGAQGAGEADRGGAAGNASSAGGGGWFGSDSWSWASSWGRSSEGCKTGDRSASETSSDEPPSQADLDDVRRRILDAFGELPAGERLATALELNMKAASDFFGTLFEGPIKAGENALDSLMKEAANVVRDVKQRNAGTASTEEPPSTPDAPKEDQETDRP